MIYTFLVLMFGIYLGQEYPQIPSVKTTVQVFIANLNKEEVMNVEETEEQGSSIKMNFVPKRQYNSLPLWISNWFSSVGSSQETVHEKSE